MKFYRRWIGDYLRDTAHLSVTEHGVYAILLDHYYATELPLPEPVEALCRICRAMSLEEQEAVASVAKAFFPTASDGLRHNSRADREIETMQKAITRMRESGKKGADTRWHLPQEVHGEGDGVPHESPDRVPNRVPIHYPITNRKPLKAIRHRHDDGFSEFWKLYPKKVGKGAAEKAWRKADAEAVLKALPTYPFSDDPKFIPHPATWLNQRRWEDETTSTSDSSWLKEVAR